MKYELVTLHYNGPDISILRLTTHVLKNSETFLHRYAGRKDKAKCKVMGKVMVKQHGILHKCSMSG